MYAGPERCDVTALCIGQSVPLDHRTAIDVCLGCQGKTSRAGRGPTSPSLSSVEQHAEQQRALLDDSSELLITFVHLLTAIFGACSKRRLQACPPSAAEPVRSKAKSASECSMPIACAADTAVYVKRMSVM